MEDGNRDVQANLLLFLKIFFFKLVQPASIYNKSLSTKGNFIIPINE
jgi:hypothetical protein